MTALLAAPGLETLARLFGPVGAVVALEANGLLCALEESDQYDATVAVGVDLLLEGGYRDDSADPALRVTLYGRDLGARDLVVAAIYWRRTVERRIERLAARESEVAS